GGVTSFLPASNGSREPVTTPPECGTGNAMILMAQAVPSATRLPCIATLPSGWTFGGADMQRGRARFWLDSDRAGARAIVVTLVKFVAEQEDLALCGAGASCPG